MSEREGGAVGVVGNVGNVGIVGVVGGGKYLEKKEREVVTPPFFVFTFNSILAFISNTCGTQL